MRSCVLIFLLFTGAATALVPAPAYAGEADVLAVEARKQGPGNWHFAVTVAHADTGWDHYADRFQIVTPDGTVLGTRVLLHPHVDEQPFTRSLGGVKVPDHIRAVSVRAGDTLHKFGGDTKIVTLKR